MIYSIYWSNCTLILYICMGIICSFSCYLANRRAIKTGCVRKLSNLEYLPWYLSWIVIAVFRCVNSSVGGTDAPDYIQYFENCLNLYSDNTDFFFKWFNCGVRYLTGNYHVYFFIYYSVVIIALIAFIINFSSVKSSCIPLTILFYLYLRSFTSMRSNFAIAILLFSIIFLQKKKYIISFIFGILAMLTHVSAFVYVTFLVFYFVYKEKKISLIKSMIVFCIAFAVGTVGQRVMTSGGLTFLSDVSTGAYVSYARRSSSLNFFRNYSVSNLPQLAIFIMLLLFRKQLDKSSLTLDEDDKSKLDIIRLMCYYDFFMVPIIFILSIYRGYEYFYIARLIMWGELIPIVKKFFKPKSRIIISVFFWIFFVVWMYGRIDATWESSHLMPYVFDLFYK